MWFDSLHNRNAIEHRLLAVDRADRDRGPNKFEMHCEKREYIPNKMGPGRTRVKKKIEILRFQYTSINKKPSFIRNVIVMDYNIPKTSSETWF